MKPLHLALVAVSAILAAVPLHAAAQGCVDYADYIHRVGRVDTPGDARGVAASGGLAYIADDGFVQVVDFSDPAAPAIVGSVALPFGGASGIDIAGSYAYVASGEGVGLRIIDISTPSSPVLLTTLATPGSADGVAVSGVYAYVADGFHGLQVVDVSDPMAPVIVGSVDTPGVCSRIDVAGKYAYIADGTTGLQVIDLSVPQAPMIVGSLATSGNVTNVAIHGSNALLTESNHPNSRLKIADISSPNGPTLVGGITNGAPGGATSVAASGTTAFVTISNFGVWAVDISDPSNPGTLGIVMTEYGPIAHVAVEGSLVLIGHGWAGLEVISIRNPASPPIVDEVPLPTHGTSVVAQGDFAYVTAGASGVHIVELAGSGPASIVGSVDTPGDAWGIAVSRGFAYVADSAPGLHVLDISNPQSPEIVGTVDTPGSAYKVTVAGSLAYVADIYGLEVVDVSNPSAPTVIGSMFLNGYVRDVAVSGDHAFVLNAASEIQCDLTVLDVSDPSAPVFVSATQIGIGLEIEVRGDVAYVASAGCSYSLIPVGYLRAFDVSNPSSPAGLATVWNGGSALALAVVGTTAYVAGSAGVQAIDVSDLSAPRKLGSAPTPAFGVAVAGDRVLLAGSSLAFLAADCASVTGMPSAPRDNPVTLLSPAPNPSRGTSVFVLDLAAPAEIRLQLFDASGRRVRELFAGPVGAGRREIVWDGRDAHGSPAASGVYLVRLETNETTTTTRLALIR